MSESTNDTITVYSVIKHSGYGMTVLNKRGENCDGYVLYSIGDNKFCNVTTVSVMDGHRNMTDKLIKIAFEDIAECGYIPIPDCDEAKLWYKKAIEAGSKKDSIMEIEPNTADGSKIFCDDDETCYDLFIEYPVREACKRLTKEKEIKTIMSSANKEDAKRAGLKEKDGEQLFIGPNNHFSIGNGYAWIMFDFDELSDDNKDIVIALNNSDIPIELSEEAKKRLENNCSSNGVPIGQRELVKFYRVVHESQTQKIQIKKPSFGFRPRTRDPRFEAQENILVHNNSLSYHGSDYDAVVLRYPIDESTSTDEIIEYYNSVINLFKDKAIIIRHLN